MITEYTMICRRVDRTVGSYVIIGLLSMLKLSKDFLHSYGIVGVNEKDGGNDWHYFGMSYEIMQSMFKQLFQHKLPHDKSSDFKFRSHCSATKR
jgi:hypothetical protein